MNNLISSLAIILLSSLFYNAFAQISDDFVVKGDDLSWKKPSYEKKLYEIGQRILTANQIHQKIAFSLNRGALQANASAHSDSGHVMIDRQLLRYIDRDDELAAVICHEIVHLTRHHARHQKMKKTIIVTPVIVGTAFINPLIPLILVKSGKLEKMLAPISQPDEWEADQRGLKLLVQAGYDPQAMIDIFTKIMGDSDLNLKTHPLTSDRIDALEKMIPSLGHALKSPATIPFSTVAPSTVQAP